MDSMEKIYTVHARTVYGFLLARTGDPDTAEELTQETFCRALKQVGGFKAPCPPGCAESPDMCGRSM